MIVADTAATAGVDLTGVDRDWWDATGGRVAAARSQWCRDDSSWPQAVPIDFPAPLGRRTVPGARIRQITTRHMQKIVSGLVVREEVQAAWASDRTATSTQPIVEVTGGFGQDSAVLAAVRAEAGRADLVPEPASAAAFGAVLAHAPNWIQPSERPTRFRLRRPRTSVPSKRQRS